MADRNPSLLAYLHDRGSIVCDRLPAVLVHHQQVATIRTERRLYRFLHSDAGVDVGQDLALALRSVGPYKVGGLSALEASADSRGSYGGVGRTFFEDDNGRSLAPE